MSPIAIEVSKSHIMPKTDVYRKQVILHQSQHSEMLMYEIKYKVWIILECSSFSIDFLTCLTTCFSFLEREVPVSIPAIGYYFSVIRERLGPRLISTLSVNMHGHAI